MRTTVYLALTIFAAAAALLASCDKLGTLQNENELEKKVRQALNADMRLRAADLTITANMETGEVTIAGEVSLPELIDIASDLAKQVEGVTSVVNKMTMQELDSGLMMDHVGTPAGSALGF